MPRVKKSVFPCPVCGSPMQVLRTRGDGHGRLVRYRSCTADDSHRITTREMAIVAINPPPVRLALNMLVNRAGIHAEVILGVAKCLDNETGDKHDRDDR